MAKITTRAQLNVGTELSIDESLKTFTLNVAGNLIAKDGVTLQALYSKFVELWATLTYQDSPFPMYAIDALSGQFQFGTDGATYSGWKPSNDATRQMLRDGGWSEYNSSGVLARQYVGIVSLGTVSTGSQLYYQKVSAGPAANFTFTDAVNEGIQVYGDATADPTTTTFDSRVYFKGYVREYSKLYKDSVLADTGKTATGAYLVNLLLSNDVDLNITTADGGISASPYSSIVVRYFASAFSREVDTVGTDRNFGIVVDVGTHSGVDGSNSAGGSVLNTATGGITGADYTGGTLVIHSGTNKGTYTISGTPTANAVTITGTLTNAQTNQSFTLQRATPVSATLQQIYTKLQYQLRSAANINAVAGGVSVTGKTAGLLANFVGSTLVTGFYAPTNPAGGGSGVLIQGLAAGDVNSVDLYDNSAAKRNYPYLSAGSISFNSVLVGGGSSYRLWFTSPPGAGNDYGEAGAVTVNDASGNPITGTISSGSISFTYDYDGNTQAGYAGGTDRPVTLIGICPGTGKLAAATGTLTRSKNIALSLVAEQDRVYI